MQLTRLDLDRLPGIREPFTLRPAAGVNVILGPNGAGKSSVCRAVGRLLWSDRKGDLPFTARGVFTADSEPWQVSRRDDADPIWSRAGQPTAAPVLPAEHLSPCYLLNLIDLIDEQTAAGDRDLAAEIKKQLSGGYDLAAAQGELFPSRVNEGRSQRRSHQAASDAVRDLMRAQAELLRRRDQLPTLDEELDHARLAGDRSRLLEQILARRKRRADLDRADALLAELPTAAEHVRREDPANAAALLKELGSLEDQLAALQAERESLAREMAALDLSAAARENLDTEDLAERERRLLSLQEACALAENAHEGLRAKLGILKGDGETAESPLPPVDAEALNEIIHLQQQFLRQQALIAELEKLEAEAPEETVRRGWLVAAVPGVILLLGAVAGLLWPEPPLENTILLGAVLVGAGLLAAGMVQRGRGEGSRSDRQHAARLRVQRLEGARGKLDEIHTGLRNWNHELDLKLDVEDPRLADLLRESQQRRQDRQDVAESEAELADRRGRRDAALDRCNERFAELGLDRAEDAEDASRRIGAFLRRRAEWDGLCRDDLTAAQSIETLERNRANRRRDLQEIADRLGVGANRDLVAAAEALLEQQPSRQQAARDHDAARRDIERLDAEIEPRIGLLTDNDWNGLTDVELERRIETERDTAATHEELIRTKAGLEADLARAEKENSLTDALAEQEEALQLLAEARHAVRDDELGRLLCDDVLEQQGSDTTSPVLKAARENFSRFTQGRYELKIDAKAAEHSFYAWDTDRDVRRALSQLSDGTRTQLLLSVRLAFLSFAEKSVRPPLFLDQALAASDPERFDRIARSIGRSVHDQDRQLFYLSCDAGDVEAWNRALRDEGLAEVHVINLETERGIEAARTLPVLSPAPLVGVPSPAGLNDVGYAERLQVPGIDPWESETRIHLFHLLRDDLPLLHRLLMAGARRLGSWRNARQHLTASGAQTATEAVRLQARGQIAGAFLDAWRIGRCRPVAPEWIREQAIFSNQKLPEVLALSDEVGRDPERLLEALRDKRIRNLRKAMTGDLEQALLASGHLDRQPTLSGEDRVLQIRRAVTRELSEGILDSEELRHLADTLMSALSAGTPIRKQTSKTGTSRPSSGSDPTD